MLSVRRFEALPRLPLELAFRLATDIFVVHLIQFLLSSLQWILSLSFVYVGHTKKAGGKTPPAEVGSLSSRP
jgi:hypothetical protein